ncbi:SAM-dependent methyltransferase [Paracoccaceae bacterium]|nr:SAM-dependent methyltransferase [Paracoccaceae bacterium]
MNLETKIKDRIDSYGPLSISKFMEMCLWDNEYGYYISNQIIGKWGDFITSPEISQSFGELLGLWSLSFHYQSVKKKNLFLTELGAGKGTLLKDATRAINKITHGKLPIEITILERSPKLREIQNQVLRNQNLKWINDIKKLPQNPQIIIANEFFDAIPIDQYVKDKQGWREKKICVISDKLTFTLDKNIWTPPDSFLSKVPQGQTLEYSKETVSIFSKICDHIKNWGGIILVIDYGNDNGLGDTLQAVSNHKFNNILEDVGKNDLSSHVNFGLLRDIAIKKRLFVSPIVNQHQFLLNLGIELRLEKLAKDARTVKSDLETSGIKRIINPEKMGSLFKVFAVSKNNQQGFEGFC